MNCKICGERMDIYTQFEETAWCRNCVDSMNQLYQSRAIVAQAMRDAHDYLSSNRRGKRLKRWFVKNKLREAITIVDGGDTEE